MERDFTFIYKKFRRSYRSTIVNVVPSHKAVFENEIYTSLIGRDYSDTIELQTLKTSSFPSSAELCWMNAYGEVQQFLVDLEGAIERLRAEHERARLDIDWETDNSSSQRFQGSKSNKGSQLLKQITGMFAVAQDKVDKLISMEWGLVQPDWQMLREGCRMAMRNKLAKLAERLRQVEDEASTRRLDAIVKNKSRAQVRMWKSSIPPPRSPAKNNVHGVGHSQLNLILLEAEEDKSTLLKESQDQEKEIARISQEMSQVLEILQNVQMMVLEQGDLLDRIDYNLEKSQRYIRRGNEQLVRAKKSSISTAHKLVLLFLVMFAFVLFIAVLAKHQ